MTRREFIQCGGLAGVGQIVGTGCADRAAVYPGWSVGELDIHFIQTGRGEQTFFILPDGTTMLVDCGDGYNRNAMKEIPFRPSGARLGGEWVARYVKRLIPDRNWIDYFVLTHWHGDHCGAISLGHETTDDGRKLCGITKFAEFFDIRHYYDHQYPRFADHCYDADKRACEMVHSWLGHMRNRCGMQAHAFEVGAKDQIRMLGSNAAKYAAAFSIRNLHANCMYWDGHGKVVDYAPEFIRRRPKLGGGIYENSLSLGFRIEYGDFKAYFGGDIDFPNYEDTLAPVVGKVDVCKMNHHGCPSSMGKVMCRTLQAKLYMSSIWSPSQLAKNNLLNMSSRELYPGERYICPGSFPASKRLEYAGMPFMNDIVPVQGHVAIKVAPGGREWGFFILSDVDESMRILYRRKLA